MSINGAEDGELDLKREQREFESEPANSKRQRIEELPRHVALAFSTFAEREAVTKKLEEQGILSYKLYTNDGSSESGKALVTLKNIFSRQLPKMPKEYIVRLVMDKNHKSLAMLKDGVIIGVNGSEQVRGFGTIMMNRLKDLVQKENIEYFLTFADNYAIGYFQKQAFVKNITMPKTRWVGFIKEYDGGTLMECFIPHTIKFSSQAEMILHQRKFLLNLVISSSRSHVRYPPVEAFLEGKTLSSMLEIPGVLEGQWTQHSTLKGVTERDRHLTMSKLNVQMKNIVDKVKAHEHSWPFLTPVTEAQAPGYYDIVKNPIDLLTISDRLREQSRVNSDVVYYRTKHMLRADLLRMVHNCKLYNPPNTEYHECAELLEPWLQTLFDQLEVASAGGGPSSASG